MHLVLLLALLLVAVVSVPTAALAAPPVSGVRAFPNPFSPNGDRISDVTVISYSLGVRGAATLQVIDARGEIKRLSGPSMKLPGDYFEIWNGVDNKGRRVPPGTYKVVASLRLPGGGLTTYASSVTVRPWTPSAVPKGPPVDTTAVASPKMITPNDDGLNDETTLEYEVGGPALVTVRIYRGAKEMRLLQPSLVKGKGTHILRWDGTDDKGRKPASGNYRFVVIAQTSGGTKTARGSLTIRQAPHSDGAKVVAKIFQAIRRLEQEGSFNRVEARNAERVLRGAAGALEEAELKGIRRVRTDIGYVLGAIEEMTDAGLLTRDRARILLGKVLPINNEYFTFNAPPRYSYTPVTSPLSPLTYVYYVDQGIQFAPVPALNRARGAYRAADWNEFMSIADELSEFFVERTYEGKTFSTLEYYFDWEGGRPPWVSGMAQGLALEALGAAAAHTGNSRYVALAEKVLRSFEVPYNVGGVLSRDEHGLGWGTWYIAFAYTDSYRTLNTFMDTLIGLHRYAGMRNGNPDGEQAKRLFESGFQELKLHLHEYDQPLAGVDPAKASWSYYSKVHGPARVMYHRYHVSLLGTFLREIAPGDPQLKAYLEKWKNGLAVMEGVGGPKILEAAPDRSIFSPDGDGEEDGVGFSYRLDRATGLAGYFVSLKIYDTEGEIKTVQPDMQLAADQASVSNPSSMSARWDGTSNDGKVVPDGSYRYVLSVTNPMAMTPAAGNVRVRNAPELVERWVDPVALSPDGDGQADATTFFFHIDRAAAITLRVENYKGAVKTLLNGQRFPKGKFTVGWNGADDGGSLLPNGTYRWTLLAENGAGKDSAQGNVIIAVARPTITEVAEPPIVTPNGDGIGDTTTFSFKTGGDGYLTLKVLDYRGEVRMVLPRTWTRAGEQRLDWNGKDHAARPLPMGGYRYVITLENQGGASQSSGSVIVN